jgi:hypothetical protein
VPLTSAWALIARQSAKRGSDCSDSGVWMKAALSIGRNRPERSRSAATTPAMSAPTGAPKKSVTAMGSGSTWPLVMSMRSSARAPGATATVISSTSRPRTIPRFLIGLLSPMD